MREAQLLKAYAVRRDAEAFAEIVRRYQRLIFATCRRTLHDASETDDAVQETFLRLAQKAGQLRSNLGGWLHACAVHVSIDSNRRRSVRAKHESSAQLAQVSAEPKMEVAELREHLDRALEKLDAQQRELIIQRFFVGRSQVDLAADAGVSPSAITHRVNSAIEALRLHLKSMGCAAIAAGGMAVLVSALEAEHASAAVPPALTHNLLKIGLSGAPPTVAGDSINFAAIFKALCLAIVIIAVSAGILLGLLNSGGASKQASGPPIETPTTAPVMTIIGGNAADTAAASFKWKSTTTVSRRSPLSGRIIDSDGKPVAGAVVTLSGNSDGSAKTNANGEYAFDFIDRAGISRVGVTADGFVPIEPYVGKDTLVQLSPDSEARRDMVLERGVSLSITVTDAQGKPLANATIGGAIAGEHDGRRPIFGPQSNDHGFAQLTLPISKSPYDIGAMLNGYAPAHAEVPADSPDKPQKALLVMERGIDVTGLAICADGKPATGWGIIAEPAWWSLNDIPPEAPVDASGRFTLHNLLPGTYEIDLSADNSHWQIATVTMPPATQPFRVDVPGVSPSARVKLVGRVRFVGVRPDRDLVFVRKLDGGDLVGQMIRIDKRKDFVPPLARNEGWFEFDSLIPGDYRLSIESSEIEPKIIEHVKVPGELPEIEVHAAPKFHLMGAIVDAADGSPITHFAVRARKLETIGDGPNYVQDENWTQVDDVSGSFDLPLIGPGAYQIQGSAPGYAWTWSEQTRVDPHNAAANVQLKLSHGGSIVGKIVGPTGSPVVGAKVIPLSMATSVGSTDRFGNENGAVMTDAAGHFTLEHLAPGEEILKVIDPSYARKHLPSCTITEGNTTDIGTVTMAVGGIVAGTVFDGDGKPVPGVAVQFSDDTGGYRGDDDQAAGRLASVVTDKDGMFRAEHLPAQPVCVDLADRWSEHGVIRRVVRPVDAKVTQLNFGGSAPVSGRCLKDGQPLPSTRLDLAVDSPLFGGLIALGATGPNGKFLFRGIPAGRYTLFVEDRTTANGWATWSDVTVSDPPKDLGDINRDRGDVLIHLQADDPADLKNIQNVDIRTFDPLQPWLNATIKGAAESAAKDQWRCKGVPPGQCAVFANFDGAPAVQFTVAFDRKAGAGEMPELLHIPHPTATLTVHLQKSLDPNARNSPVVLQNMDGTIQIHIGTDPAKPDTFSLPAGTYRVMEQPRPNYSSPRRDLAPITIGENDRRDLTIAPPAKEARSVPVLIRIWQADGELATDATPSLQDSQGNAMPPVSPADLGMLFHVPIGHYRVIVKQASKPTVTSEIDVTVPSTDWQRVPIDVIAN